VKAAEPVVVKGYRGTTLDGAPCEPSLEFSKQIDWSNSSDRKWFMNHLTWSLMNGREVRLFASNHAPSTIC
jgi:hypothetical protein